MYSTYKCIMHNIKLQIVHMFHAVCYRYAKLNFKQIK